ncbi:shikimate kinase [Brevibacillus massiliensis]|uniref:shikimate kinase n=1 Tax=Brevibacillus massiliensis TaxID=1118054 RepID=UPI0002FCE9F9|nr:shikimate kinase [Brevibacillus massiliensis]
MDNIIFVGFTGTGKSTVGKALAQALGRRHIDLDEAIVEADGRTIPDIFRDEGEPFFRQLESAVLARLLKQNGLVISTGGGAVLNMENVRRMMESGLVVNVRAAEEEIVRRLSGFTNRPLLVGDVRERVRKLLKERAGRYDFAPLQIETTGRDVSAIVEEIIEKMTEVADSRKD